jgi:hypothetical protein
MTSAIVREGKELRLSDVPPNLSALWVYLRRENGGMPLSELKTCFGEKENRDLHEMSDGLPYAINNESKC